jgi:hypothetical protein
MATTKKSTKAKSKTAKKPVTKATKAAAAAKKSVSAKPVKATLAPKSTNVSTRTSKRSALANLQIVTILLSIGLAVLAGLYMSQKSYQLFTGLLTSDELASTTSAVFVPAIRSLYDVEVRWLAVAAMALSAIFPLLYMTQLKRLYEQGRQKRAFLWRWIENGVIGALLLGITALLSGVQDLLTLKVLAGLVIVSALLAWTAEKQHAEAQRPATAAFLLSLITGLLPWLLIGAYAIATPIFGLVRNTGFVYGLYAILLAGFLANALNLRKYLRNTSTAGTYELAERNYSLINLLVRTGFAITLIVGLLNQ